MGRIGLLEALLIVIGFLLLFGSKRLPKIGAALGKAVREFRQAVKNGQFDGTIGKESG